MPLRLPHTVGAKSGLSIRNIPLGLVTPRFLAGKRVGRASDIGIKIIVPVEVELTDSSVDATDTDVYTFSSQAIGVAANNRHIVVGVSNRSSQRTFTSVTIAGNVMAQVVQDVSTDSEIAFYIFKLTVGTTADVVVTMSGAQSRCGIGVWRLIGASGTATDTDSDTGATSPHSVTVNVPKGGVCLGYAIAPGGSPSAWGGVIEDFDEVVETTTDHTGGSVAVAEGNATLGVTVTMGSPDGSDASVYATFGP